MDAPEERSIMARKKKEIKKRKERDDGRICIQFRYQGKRYSAYGDSTAEAEENAQLMKAQVMAGTYVPVREKRRMEREALEAEKAAEALRVPTFEKYAEEWIEQKRTAKRKETTIRSNTIMVRLISDTLIDSVRFGSIPLDMIKRVHVRKLQAALSSKVSSRTTNDCIIAVRSIYKSAIADEIVIRNPADKIMSVERTEEPATRTYHRALTREETASFFKAAKGSRYYNLYVVLLNTGLRCGEACALYASDIGDKGIMVNRTVTRTETGGYMIGSEPKTKAGRRFVPLKEPSRMALRDQLDINAALRSGTVIPMREPVFRAARGGLLHSSIVNADIAKYCKLAGIEKFTCHALRDTFATRFVEAGGSYKELGRIMGHEAFTMTMKYTQGDIDRMCEQMNAVNFM